MTYPSSRPSQSSSAAAIREILRSIEYRIDFPIRGLLIDKRFGHILKMDRFKVVQKGYHGLRNLSKDEIRALYQQKKIRHHGALPLDRHAVRAQRGNSLHGHRRGFEQKASSSTTARLFMDIRECIDEAHRDGTILTSSRTISRATSRRDTTSRRRSTAPQRGQEALLLTNSRWASPRR